MFDAVQLDPGFMIGAVGLLIAAIQIVLGIRRERFENTFRVIQWLQEPDVLRVRNRSRDIMAAAKELQYDFYKLSVDDRAALSGLANLFGFVGLLAQKNLIQRNLIVEGWARHVIATYERLGPYFEWRRTMPGGDSLRPHFEWLTAQCQRYCRL